MPRPPPGRPRRRGSRRAGRPRSAGAFVVAGQRRDQLRRDLARVGIDGLAARSEQHSLDAEIAVFAPLRGEADARGGGAADELDLALGGENAEPVVNDGPPAEAPGILEGFGELRQCVELAASRLLVEQAENDVVLAHALGVMLGAHLGAHEALVHRVDLDPLAAHLVDQLRGQRRAVAQFDLQLAL